MLGDMIEWSVYDRNTGVVKFAGRSGSKDTVVLQADPDAGESLYIGKMLRIGVDQVIDGKAVLGDEPPPPLPTDADVKDHASRLLRRTDWMVTRSHESGGKPVPDEVAAYRVAVRQASNAIELMPGGIPADYRDPKYWPQVTP